MDTCKMAWVWIRGQEERRKLENCSERGGLTYLMLGCKYAE